MIEKDSEEFVDMWLTAHEVSVSNKQPSNNAVNASFETLMDYELVHIQKALMQHRRKCKFAPTPFDIIELLETNNKRPLADEAWSMCPLSEDDTTVWTEEMAEAFAIAYPLLQDGDKIGARMAFKAAYDRICNLSSLQSKPIHWKVSIGYDKTMIESVVQRAIELGRLTHQQAVKYIPVPTGGGPIGGLLTGKVVDISSNKNKKIKSRLNGIKTLLSDIDKKQQQDEVDRQEAEVSRQKEFERKKREAEILCMQKDLSK